MATNNLIGFHSPKNKFWADVHYRLRGFRKGLWNVTSMGDMSVDCLKYQVQAMHNLNKHTISEVQIWQNLKQYPEFDWVLVESYTIK